MKQGGEKVTEFHIVGGLHPKLLVDYYEDVLAERLEKAPPLDGKAVRKSARQYLQDFIKGMED